MSSTPEKEEFLSNKEYIDLQRKAKARSSEGDCYGASGLAAEAVLTGEVERFNAQSRWLKTVAQCDPKKPLQLSHQQKSALYGFLGDIQRNQDPYLYRETLERSFRTYTQDLAETMKLNQSTALKALGGLYKVGVFSGFYNFANADIEHYFAALKTAVVEAHDSQRQIPFSLVIMNGNHALLLGYRPAEDLSLLGTWFVFDINPRFIIREISWDDASGYDLAFEPVPKNGMLKKTIYLQQERNILHYTFVGPKDEPVQGSIPIEGVGALTQQPLNELKEQVLEIISKRVYILGNVISFLIRGLLPGQYEQYGYMGNIAIRTEFYCSQDNEEKAIALQADFLSNLKRFGLATITADKVYKKDMFEITWFEMAIKAGDIDAVQTMMSMIGPGKPISINSLKNSGQDILILAVAIMRGYTEIVRLLLVNGFEVSSLPEVLALSISQSVYGSDFPKILDLLIQYGAEINSRDSRQYTALMCAAEKGRYELVQFLLDKGADPNLKNGDYSAIMTAVEKGHSKVVKILIDAGADVNGTNMRRESTLMLFIENIPIEDGYGYSEMAKALVAKVKDINLKNKRGLSALVLAVQHQCIEIAGLLIQKGAEVPDDARFWEGLLRGLFIFIQEKGSASILASFEILLETKLETLIAQKTVTTDEKQCLIKLYIVLCHIEEQQRLNQASNSSNARDIQFFSPDRPSKMDVKIKIATALLEANGNSSLSEVLALNDNRLNRIAKLCAVIESGPSATIVPK